MNTFLRNARLNRVNEKLVNNCRAEAHFEAMCSYLEIKPIKPYNYDPFITLYLACNLFFSLRSLRSRAALKIFQYRNGIVTIVLNAQFLRNAEDSCFIVIETIISF